MLGIQSIGVSTLPVKNNNKSIPMSTRPALKQLTGDTLTLSSKDVSFTGLMSYLNRRPLNKNVGGIVDELSHLVHGTTDVTMDWLKTGQIKKDEYGELVQGLSKKLKADNNKLILKAAQHETVSSASDGYDYPHTLKGITDMMLFINTPDSKSLIKDMRDAVIKLEVDEWNGDFVLASKNLLNDACKKIS